MEENREKNIKTSKSSMDKTTLEVYQHYGLEQDKKDVESESSQVLTSSLGGNRT